MNKKEVRNIAKYYIKRNIVFAKNQDINLVVEHENGEVKSYLFKGIEFVI